jgi:hypothetical protein
MPIVAQLVSSEFGRPVAVDAHPKHAVALGAAWLASGAEAKPADTGTISGRATPPPPPASQPPTSQPPTSQLPASRRIPAAAPLFAGVAAVPPAGNNAPVEPPELPAAVGRTRAGGSRARRRRLLAGTGLAVAALLVAGGVAYAQYGRDDSGRKLTVGGAAGASTAANATPSATTPADELCTNEIKSNRRWVCLTSAVVANGKITIKYDVEYAGSKPDVNNGYHLHIYGGDGTHPPDHVMSSYVPQSKGKYYWEDQQPSILKTTDSRFASAIGNAKKVCARIAIAGHGLVPDAKNTYKTGNCVPITRS